MGRFYCEGVSNEEITEVENKITYLLTQKTQKNIWPVFIQQEIINIKQYSV